MAGSFNHVIKKGQYVGTSSLENMGDATEAIEQMAFMLLAISKRWGGESIITDLQERYYRCVRGEESWPDWFTETPDAH